MRTPLLLVAAVLAFSCARKPVIQPDPPVTAPAAAQEQAAPPAPVAQETRCSSDSDCGGKELCVGGRCLEVRAALAECGPVRVQFAFSSSIIEEQQRRSLERSARCLRADQAIHVTIAGHADERGTEEFNLMLGQQRATGVASYLRALGASEDQLRTVSYGEERPLCSDKSDPCWDQNRRASVKF